MHDETKLKFVSNDRRVQLGTRRKEIFVIHSLTSPMPARSAVARKTSNNNKKIDEVASVSLLDKLSYAAKVILILYLWER